MHPLLCSAITMRQVIRFRYHGGYRVVEPFCYGVSHAGYELLRAYQIEGHSESGSSSGWKLFRVDEMSELSVAEDVRASFNPNDPAMEIIYCRA
jgi:hypothetical protein